MTANRTFGLPAPAGVHLDMWVVYDKPTDFPDRAVARRFLVGMNEEPGPLPTSQVITAQEVDTIRQAMRRVGRIAIARDPSDDPNIVEIWL